MAVQDDVAAAREAVRALERAVAAVAGYYPQSVDARRLQSDVARVAEDLHLLVGQAPPPPPVAPRLEVIDDAAYPQDFWMDAEDEGLGGGR
jgi:phosphate uptake regulator